MSQNAEESRIASARDAPTKRISPKVGWVNECCGLLTEIDTTASAQGLRKANGICIDTGLSSAASTITGRIHAFVEEHTA